LGNFDEAEITIHSRKTTLMIEKILLRIFIYLSDDLNRNLHMDLIIFYF